MQATLGRVAASKKSRRRVTPLGLLIRTALYLALVFGAVIMLTPFIWTLSSSFKNVGDIYNYPPQLIPPQPIADNYVNLFGTTSFVHWFINSFGVAFARVSLTLFLSALGGFAFAKYRFRGRNFLFGIMFLTLALPVQVVVVPLFLEMNKISWVNSYQALFVPFVAPAIGIFLVRQFMINGVPDEMLEAGRLDGCSEFRLFWRLALPLSRPALGALAIQAFLWSWNDFLWPLLILSSDSRYTLTLGLQTLASESQQQYGLLMAGAFLAALPLIVLFIFMQRQFVSGLTIGAVKG